MDEDRPKQPATPLLDGLSIEDLEARVQRLEREIAECRRLIAQKRSVRAAADALFSGGA